MFIGGGKKYDKHNINWVGCKELCEMKNKSELGFKDLKSLNLSFLAKIGI